MTESENINEYMREVSNVPIKGKRRLNRFTVRQSIRFDKADYLEAVKLKIDVPELTRIALKIAINTVKASKPRRV